LHGKFRILTQKNLITWLSLLGFRLKFWTRIVCFVSFVFATSLPSLAFEIPELVKVTEAEDSPNAAHKETLEHYTKKFCQQRGRANYQIQNKIVVDCLTSNTLWKIEYADNWQKAMAEALTYAIYDDYQGDEEKAPQAGVVLIHEDSDDYKNMLKLKQLVEFHNLPIRLEKVENFTVPRVTGNGSPASSSSASGISANPNNNSIEAKKTVNPSKIRAIKDFILELSE
jgi:hypothetical protein